MNHITGWDWLVIAAYLAAVTAIGLHAARKVKSSASFFISDRQFGKLFMIFLGFGAGSHADQAVSVAAKSYRAGASGIWYQWLWLFVTPFYWLTPLVVRRMRIITMADYYQNRFDRSVSVLNAAVGIFQLAVGMGVMLRGSAVMVTACSGGEISPGAAIVLMTVLFVVYGVAGGITAAIVTDLLQGILTIVLSFLILPFAMSQVGWMSGLRAAVEDPAMFQLVSSGTAGEINALFITVISFNALIGWITQPGVVLGGAGKTELESRVGQAGGSLIKRFCTVAWALTGLCAVAYYAGENMTDEKIEQVFGLMANELLPMIAPGLLGLFIASMLASVMSTCDSQMVVASGLFVQNIYRPFVAADKNDRHYILMGRIVSVLVVAGSIIFAFSVQSVVTGLEVFWKVAAMMGVAAWLGIFWRGTTVAGVWAGTLAGFSTWLFTETLTLGKYVLWDFNAQLAGRLPDFMLWENKLYLPWQMITYLTVSFIFTVTVSLLTKRVDSRRLDRFYACLRTPITPNEPETRACTLPEGVTPAPRRVLINHPDFEIPVPSWTSVIGFAVLSILVVLIIYGAVWIFSLGQ